jgi:hypothetical protein
MLFLLPKYIPQEVYKNEIPLDKRACAIFLCIMPIMWPICAPLRLYPNISIMGSFDALRFRAPLAQPSPRRQRGQSIIKAGSASVFCRRPTTGCSMRLTGPFGMTRRLAPHLNAGCFVICRPAPIATRRRRPIGPNSMREPSRVNPARPNCGRAAAELSDRRESPKTRDFMSSA